MEEKQPDPEKRQDVLVERIVWAWDHMMHKYTIYSILLQVGMGGFIGLVGSSPLMPPTTCPSGTYTCLHGVSVAASWLFDPRVGYDKTYITPMGMQHTSVHSRTTQCYGTDWEYCTW